MHVHSKKNYVQNHWNSSMWIVLVIQTSTIKFHVVALLLDSTQFYIGAFFLHSVPFHIMAIALDTVLETSALINSWQISPDNHSNSRLQIRCITSYAVCKTSFDWLTRCKFRYTLPKKELKTFAP